MTFTGGFVNLRYILNFLPKDKKKRSPRNLQNHELEFCLVFAKYLSCFEHEPDDLSICLEIFYIKIFALKKNYYKETFKTSVGGKSRFKTYFFIESTDSGYSN